MKVITEMQCYKLSGAASAKSDENYGAPPAYHGTPAANTNPPPQAMFHAADRVLNQEAVVTAFQVENPWHSV